MARRTFVGRNFPVRQGRRKETVWLASANQAAVKTLAAASSVLDQFFSSAQLVDGGLLPGTIVRTRGVLYTKSDSVAAVEEPFGALSFSIVGDAARIAGIASLNTPIEEEAAEQYFVYEQWFGGNTALAAGAADGRWYVQSFDSKAMRKVEEGESIAIILENAHASHGVFYIIKYRMLMKVS